MDLLAKVEAASADSRFKWIRFESTDFELFARSLSSRELDLLRRKFTIKKGKDKGDFSLFDALPTVLPMIIKDWRGMTASFIKERFGIEVSTNIDEDQVMSFDVPLNGSKSKALRLIEILATDENKGNTQFFSWLSSVAVDINKLKEEEEEKKIS